MVSSEASEQWMMFGYLGNRFRPSPISCWEKGCGEGRGRWVPNGKSKLKCGLLYVEVVNFKDATS